MFSLSLSFSSVYSLSPELSCSVFSFSSFIVSIVLCPLICSLFHCFQFLSSLPQYSSLYCVINEQWMSLVITLGRCSRRTQWSSFLDWTTTYTTFTVAVLLLVHDHMFLQNVLQPCDLITWLGFLSSPAIYISTPLYALRFWTKCLNAQKTFSCLGLL